MIKQENKVWRNRDRTNHRSGTRIRARESTRETEESDRTRVLGGHGRGHISLTLERERIPTNLYERLVPD